MSAEKVLQVSTVIFDLLRTKGKYFTYSENRYEIGEKVTVYNDAYNDQLKGVKVTARVEDGDDYKYWLDAS